MSQNESAAVTDAANALREASISAEPRTAPNKDAKWEVRSDAHQGRYLVSTTAIKAGEIVLQELPYAFVPFEGPEGQVRPSLFCAKRRTPVSPS